MNVVWMLMILGGIVWTILRPGGDPLALQRALFQGVEDAALVAFGLVGLLAFWSGLMKIADEAGLTRLIARFLSPVVRPLFPSIPKGHPALGSALLSMAANTLGLGNAATPLGIKAMQELQRLNPSNERASEAMSTFFVMTASGLTVVPATVIALRAAAGSQEPAAIVGTTLVATSASTAAAIAGDWVARAWRKRR